MDDEVRELIEDAGWQPTPPQPSRQQMVDAYETATAYKERNPDSEAGVEQLMLEHQGEDIDKVQAHQRDYNQVKLAIKGYSLYVAPITTRQLVQWWKSQPETYYDVMAEVDQYLQWQKDEAKKAEMREAVKKAADALAEMGHSFESAVKALGHAITGAMRPILDLLDQMEAISSQPLCPSHGAPMRGGRCPRCDRSSR